MKILLSYKFWAFVVMSTITLTACEKVKDDTFEPKRYFSPGRITATSGELEAKLSWDPSLFLQSPSGYEVEVSLNENFDPVYKTFTTDSAAIILTPNDVDLKTPYFARVRAKSSGAIAASVWELSSGTFRITGEQLFGTIIDTDIKDVRATLRFRLNEALTHIKLTNIATQESFDYTLTEEDIENGLALIPGLSPLTAYTATLFNNTLERGEASFTTKELSLYTIEITPDDDFATIIAEANSGDVIGLAPGVYDIGTEAVLFFKKHVVIASTSGDPTDTKLNYKEFTLKGDGAGITIRGVTINQSNVANSYVLNFVGETANNAAAAFTSVTIENCIIDSVGRAIIRGSQGSAAFVQSMDFIKLENVWVRECNNDYALLDIHRLAVNNVSVTKSTFSSFKHSLIRYDTKMEGWNGTFTLDQLTINNFGSSNRRVLFDINNETPVNITLQNSIIANTPKVAEGLNANLYRVGTGQSIFNSVYTYNLVNGVDPFAPLVTPGQTFPVAPITWTHATTDFTLPTDSPLRTASTTGGPVGDPRWAL